MFIYTKVVQHFVKELGKRGRNGQQQYQNLLHPFIAAKKIPHQNNKELTGNHLALLNEKQGAQCGFYFVQFIQQFEHIASS